MCVLCKFSQAVPRGCPQVENTPATSRIADFMGDLLGLFSQEGEKQWNLLVGQYETTQVAQPLRAVCLKTQSVVLIK